MLDISFELGFASSVVGILAGVLLMFGTFTWDKPKGPRKVGVNKLKYCRINKKREKPTLSASFHVIFS